MSSNSKKPPGGKDDGRKNPSSKEDSPAGGKDDGGSASTTSNGGAAAGEAPQPGSKPSSAGATAREGAQRLLGLAARGEWAPVDQLLKSLEKTVQSAGDGDGLIVPLAGLLDPVSFHIGESSSSSREMWGGGGQRGDGRSDTPSICECGLSQSRRA